GKNSFFRPGDLTTKAATDKQQGIYIPFWHFSMQATSQWSAQIGEYWYRTETYHVKDSDGKMRTMTRVVQETEWWPLSGIYRNYYSGYMVSASKGLPQTEALAIQPYRLNTMMRFRPMYLAGWMSEEYSVSREQALAITEREFQQRERDSIHRFLPGDRSSGLSVQTDLDVGGSDLILLPVHVLSYRYGNRVFRFLVNGQTGATYGEKPWSNSRIAAVVIGVALLIMVIVALVIVLNHPRLN
ncbi:MAG: zinc ribbon domain-containing protein, partial [Pirellula sp.]